MRTQEQYYGYLLLNGFQSDAVIIQTIQSYHTVYTILVFARASEIIVACIHV